WLVLPTAPKKHKRQLHFDTTLVLSFMMSRGTITGSTNFCQSNFVFPSVRLNHIVKLGPAPITRAVPPETRSTSPDRSRLGQPPGATPAPKRAACRAAHRRPQRAHCSLAGFGSLDGSGRMLRRISARIDPVIDPITDSSSSTETWTTHEQTAAHLRFNPVRGCPCECQGSRI